VPLLADSSTPPIGRCRVRISRFLIGTAFVLVCALLPSVAAAQQVDANLWITNGAVSAVAAAGDTIYIGGNFTLVGPHTGGGAPIGASSATALWGFPKVHGVVRAVAPDGSGGWFIGGLFDSVGSLPRSSIAHIRSNLTVAPWAPNANDTVLALAVKDSIVYAGGKFTSIGGQTRHKIAALDAYSGLATSWNPGASNPNSIVYALLVHGSTVYVGGDFDNIGGQSRHRIAALRADSGSATLWDPNSSSTVYALAAYGSTIYAGGAFNDIGGQSRSGIVALDESTGFLTSWDANAPSGSVVQAIALSNPLIGEPLIYVGGNFTSMGGQPRNFMAALDAQFGFATEWSPNPDAPVSTLALSPTSPTTIYAGGQFTSIAGQPRNFVAALDTTGLATSWVSHASRDVRALAADASTVYVGGDFIVLGAQLRNRLAALNVKTGLPTSWNPNANNGVNALAVSGSLVYVGGNFTGIGGQTRNRIAAVDAVTGFATSWNPDANAAVLSLAVSGGTVYAGGNFGTIGSAGRNFIAALSTATGLAAGWNPNANGTVQCLALAGGVVYAGGNFSNIGGQGRNRIAALSAATGTATGWNPNANSSAVSALAISGSTVYAGGAFATIGGQMRQFIAALDATTGAATTWNPGASNAVTALAVSGSRVYAGGGFTTIGGQSRLRIAELDAGTGLATSWAPNANSNVFAFAVRGSMVYAAGAFDMVGGVPSRGIAAITMGQAVTRVQPNHGGNSGPVTAVVEGNGFQSGAAVKLTRAGQDIIGTAVTVTPGGGSLSATFDLKGKVPGFWDVVVTNPDSTSATLLSGFTVENLTGPQLRVDLLGPSLMRGNRRTAFDLVIDNPGNIDAQAVPVWIAGVPTNATVELGFPLAYPPRTGGEPDWSTVPLGFTSPSGRYVPIVIPRVPPGTTTRRIYLTVPLNVTSFMLRAATTPPWADGNTFRNCLVTGGVITNPACMGTQLTNINAYLASHLELEGLSGVGVWAKVAWNCEGSATLPAALVKAEQILDYMVSPVESPASAILACRDVLPPRWRDSLVVTIVGSVDPNDKFGSRDTLSAQQAVPYSIRFENLSTATAPAQTVVVVDALSPATLDPATVSLDAITFGDVRVVPPLGLRSYATQVDLRPTKNLLVNVSAGVDVFTGVLTWYFTSIDPATGQPPLNPLTGFLPPNVTPPEGEGSVLFTVRPKPGLAGGTQIGNVASITFDENAPLATPMWQNLLDGSPPASRVMPIAATSDQPSVPVQWAPDGAPAPDLKDYTVYVSEDGSPYRVWRLNTTATNDTLVPPGNHVVHQYAFYSVARDRAGNIETAPPGADATTQARTAVGSGAAVELALEGARPNPAHGAMVVWFTLPSREPATLEVMDIAGRRVLRREVGSLGAGTHAVELGGARAFRPGLYFLRLLHGSRALKARVVVIR
jgi:trimeric autotransporter adhesin